MNRRTSIWWASSSNPYRRSDEQDKRLINIVQVLMILSETEEIGMKIDLDTVDINATITHITKIFKPRIEEKGLRLELELEEKIPPIRGDQLKLEQVFINLVDNAAKYTDAGKIRISSRIIKQFLILEIKDTGSVPDKSHLLNRINTEKLEAAFENFSDDVHKKCPCP